MRKIATVLLLVLVLLTGCSNKISEANISSVIPHCAFDSDCGIIGAYSAPNITLTTDGTITPIPPKRNVTKYLAR